MMGKPKIRFKGYNEDWEQRKLGEVFEQTTNFVNLSKDDIELWSLTVEDGLTPKSERYNREFLVKKDTNFKEVRPGDIVYNPMNMTLGAVGYNGMSKSVAISGYYTTMITKDGNDSYYINTWLKSPQAISLYKIYATGSLIEKQRVQFPTLSTIPAVFPKYEEQHKIGCYFEAIDHLITLHQHKCDEMKKFKKCMLQKMFPKNSKKVPEIRFDGFTNDWEQRKLGDLVLDHNAGIYISKENYGEGINVIGVGNIYDSDIFNGEIYRLGTVNDDKFLLEEADIIYGESSLVPEGIARTVCVGKNGAGSAFAWHTRRVKLDNNIVNSHVATLELNYLHDVRKYLVSVSTQTALTGITTDGYFGTTLVLPSVEEQHKISDYFKSLDHLITLHQHKCDELQNLKKYMLQNMFV